MPDFYKNSILLASQLKLAFEAARSISVRVNNIKDSNSLKKILSGLHFNCYQCIIQAMTGHFYESSQAKEMWTNILTHQGDLICALKRDPGVIVAALDYLENIAPLDGTHYVFIEQNELSQLIEVSLVDGLTQLYNRSTFELLIDKEIELCKRHQLSAALLLIDLDNFKTINDQNGHQQGDHALRTAARIIQASIRSMDIAGRYGGDEFIVFLPEASKEDALIIAKRIKDGIKKELHILNNESCNGGTVSIGISLFPNNGRNIEDLIHSSDMALLKAKANGKNTIVNSIYSA